MLWWLIVYSYEVIVDNKNIADRFIEKLKKLNVKNISVSRFSECHIHIKFKFSKLLNLRKLVTQKIIKAFFIYNGEQITEYYSSNLLGREKGQL